MKWVTEEQAERAAKRGLLAAVRCSKKHWWQARKASEEELTDAYDKDEFSVYYDRCALCEYRSFHPNEPCPLIGAICKTTNCCKEWWAAETSFLLCIREYPNSKAHQVFQICAGLMYDKLASIEKKIMAEKAKK